MKHLGRCIVLAALVVFAPACFNHDAKVSLNPNGDGAVLTVGTNPGATSGTTNAITIDPAIAGSDYTNAKDKLDSATIRSITFTVENVYPDDRATQLTNATVVLTDTVTGASQTFSVGAPIAIVEGASNEITVLTPDPSSFISGIMKSAHPFTLVASGTIDAAPAHFDMLINIGLTLSISMM